MLWHPLEKSESNFYVFDAADKAACAAAGHWGKPAGHGAVWGAARIPGVSEGDLLEHGVLLWATGSE